MLPEAPRHPSAPTTARQRSRIRSLPRRLRAAPAGVPRLLRAIRREPIETFYFVPEQLSHWMCSPVPYEVEEEWGRSFHDLLGFRWPCPEMDAFHNLWGRVNEKLAAEGLPAGRWTSGTYSDADSALSACVWCSVRHLRPVNIVETGVARGVTSRVILEAIAANGVGHLWSVDLPNPFASSDLEDQTGVAIPDHLRADWTYVRGSSRRQLRTLVEKLGVVDLFVHDSLHTVRNMRFEMETVWPVLRDRRLLIVDDVDKAAFRDFATRRRGHESRVYRSGDGPWMWGVVWKVSS